jgi:D-glycero-alpha-D-manno-heptose 1-phosphate guanylyltransferase
MKVIILAGGIGTRLRGVVPNLPKPMAPVAGRAFLEYLLDHLETCGVVEVTLSIGYRGDLVSRHFGSKYGTVAVRYCIETELLGTGGAIALAMRQVDGEPVLVINGDTFLDQDPRVIGAWYRGTLSDVGVVLRQVDDATRYGTARLADGRVTGFAEKGTSGPGLINAGWYVIRPGLLDRLSLNGRFSFEEEVLQRRADVLDIRGFVSSDYFIDIGVPDDYARAQHELPAVLSRLHD